MREAVLLIDSDITFLGMISSLLEFNDFTVISLHDTENLEQILDNRAFAAVVADIMTPGITIEQWSDNIASRREIPMIMTGIRDLDNTERKQLLSHAIPFVKKPCMPSVICDKVKKIIR